MTRNDILALAEKIWDYHHLNHRIKESDCILVQKPYMERRSYAVFKKHQPDKEVVVTSPQISFKKYPNKDIPLEKIIHIMVGDLQRIKLYAEKGFQIPQEIPADVWMAYEELIKMGYDKHLVY